jgi:hypothetical protein
MKKLGCFLSVLFFMLPPVPTFAADVTLFGGVQHQGKLTFQSAAQSGTNLTFNPKNFGVFGFRASQGRVIGSEHTLAYAPNFIESQTKAFIYNSNLIVHAPLPKVRPYGTAGLGSIFSFGNGPGDIGTKLAINYGGGLKILPAGPVGIRFDVRGYTVFSVKVPSPTSIQSQTLKIIEASVGVIFSY